MSDIMTKFNQWRATLATYAPTLRIVLCALLVLTGVVGARVMRAATKKIYAQFSAHSPEWLRILTAGFLEPGVLLFRVLLCYLAVYAFPWPAAWMVAAYSLSTKLLRIAIIALISWGFWNSSSLCQLLLRSAQNRLDLATNKTMLQFFEKIYRALVLIFALITILNELHFEVSAIVTGAGLAGLTLSLAAQSTISNLVAGVALVMERPFGIGDWVVIGQQEGKVEDISFRSTRLRTVDNALISIENATICSASIRNVADRTSRLWSFRIGVKYDTPRERLENLSAALRGLLKGEEQILTDTVEVYLASFAECSIEIELRCYVTTLDPVAFRQLQNRLNLAIMDRMAAQGCEFAFPSTSVYLENAPEPPAEKASRR